MSSVRRSGRPPKPKRIEHTLAVTPRGRGRPKGSTSKTKSTPSRTPKSTKKAPWEEDEEYALEYAEDVYDEDDEDPIQEEDLDLFDFDDVDEELDLDSVTKNSSFEELPEGSLCPWLEMEPSSIPLLELPSSSNDLALPHKLLMKTLEVYEICRSFYRSLYISPFLIEDFCATLATTENTPLLSELHICLFKMCLRDDDEEQVQYTVMDTHNSFNILIQLLEPMTYGEILRQYAQAHRGLIPNEVLEALNHPEYPFVGPEPRLHVLGWLCDRFLQSQEFKKIIKNDGKLIPDDKCRDCNKVGDLLPCDTCEATYHLQCADVRDVPEGAWCCSVCELHKMKGVFDCVPINQSTVRQPLRMNPLGRDRHGRIYWFVTRRIFIHDENGDELVYYSTAPQLHELITRFDDERLEITLCKRLKENLALIVDQMAVTMELTNERRDEVIEKKGTEIEQAYLHIDNLNRISDIVSECIGKRNEMDEDYDMEEGMDDPSEDVSIRMERMIGIEKGRLMNTFWSAGIQEDGVLEHKRDKDRTDELDDPKSGFRLGRDDMGYRTYQNHYSLIDLAKPASLRLKERDRRKYMCGRFSLSDEGHFEWSLAKGKDLYGSQVLAARYIEWMINKMYKRIPSELMHRRWNTFTEKFAQLVATGRSVSILKEALLLMECGMRKTLFLPQWWNSLGSTSFRRMTLEWREERSKEEKAKKKNERELVIADAEDDSIIWVKYTKLGGPPKHNIWRMKDEQYRVNGREVLGGWYWLSSTANREKKEPSIRIKKGKKNKSGIEWDEKNKRLDSIIDKLNEKMRKKEKKDDDKEEEEDYIEGPIGCFSPSCNGDYKGCYSIICRIKAKKAATKEAIIKEKELKEKQLKELGGLIPYPMPQPLKFEARNGKKSILILKPRYLRRLARTGGLNQSIFFPGFSHTAKCNPSAWNYPCMRPFFDHCWRYNTMMARSMHALALQLRLLWCGVRWSDMTPNDEKERRVIIHHADRDEIRQVIGHKEMPPDGTYERYEIVLTSRSLDGDSFGDDDDTEGDEEFPSRNQRGDVSGRKRKAAIKAASRTSRKNQITKTKTWIDGVDLKLYEIIDYWLSKKAPKTRPPESIQNSPSGRPLRTSSINMQGKYAMMHEGGSQLKSPMTLTYKRARYDLNDMNVVKYDDRMNGHVAYTRNVNDVNVRRTGQGKEFAVGFIRGGGKIPGDNGNGETPSSIPQRRVVMVNPPPGEGGRPRAMTLLSPMDDPPPLIPRYDSPNINRSINRQMGSGTSNVVPQRVHAGTGGKVIMIRRPDGSTQLLRPVAGGGNGIDEGGEGGRMINDDGRRIINGGGGISMRGAVNMMGGGQGRIVRMQGNGRGLRPAEDPFMKRMNAIDKGGASTSHGGGGQPRMIVPSGRRMQGGGDVYATYYGEHLNESIPMDSYQVLASQGYRPPGRPPGRLATIPIQKGMMMGGARLVARPQMYQGGIGRGGMSGVSNSIESRRRNEIDIDEEIESLSHSSHNTIDPHQYM